MLRGLDTQRAEPGIPATSKQANADAAGAEAGVASFDDRQGLVGPIEGGELRAQRRAGGVEGDAEPYEVVASADVEVG